MLTETKQLPQGMMEIIPNKIEKELSKNENFPIAFSFASFYLRYLMASSQFISKI